MAANKDFTEQEKKVTVDSLKMLLEYAYSERSIKRNIDEGKIDITFTIEDSDSDIARQLYALARTGQI